MICSLLNSASSNHLEWLNVIDLLQVLNCNFSYSCAAVDKTLADKCNSGPSYCNSKDYVHHELFFRLTNVSFLYRGENRLVGSEYRLVAQSVNRCLLRMIVSTDIKVSVCHTRLLKNCMCRHKNCLLYSTITSSSENSPVPLYGWVFRRWLKIRYNGIDMSWIPKSFVKGQSVLEVLLNLSLRHSSVIAITHRLLMYSICCVSWDVWKNWSVM